MNLFKRVFLYSIGFFLSLIVLTELFTRIFDRMTAKITALAGVSDIAQATTDQFTTQAPGLAGALYSVIFLILLFVVLILYTYSFFENLSWNAIFNKKTTWKSTNKFFGLNILLGIILSVAVAAIFFIISKFNDQWIKFGVTVFYLSILIAMYLMYVGYVSFGRTHTVFRSIKNALTTGFKRLDVTILPLVIGLTVGVIINLVLLAFQSINPTAYLVIEGVSLAAYVAWFRIYFANALKSVKL